MDRYILLCIVLAFAFAGCKVSRSELSDIASESDASRRMIVISDTEGMREALDARIRDGSLSLQNSGDGPPRLEFGPEGDNALLLFVGDLGGRGANGIWLRDQLLSLRRRNPDRVVLLSGNHDDGRLALLRDLDLHSELVSDLQLLNTDFSLSGPRNGKERALADYVVNWFDGYGLKDALMHHFAELQHLHPNSPVTLEGAALNYFESVRPGGELFQYLSLCQDVYAGDFVVSVHGGLTEENFGFVGGDPTRYDDVREWSKVRRRRRNEDFNAIRQAFAGERPLSDIRGFYTVVYADAKYDAASGTLVPRNESVIYPFRYKEDGSFRMWPKKVVETLKSQGFRIGIVGHSPVPVPTILTVDGFSLLMADTSFASSEARLQNSVTINEDKTITTVGRFQDGAESHLTFRSPSAAWSPIGKIAAGYIIVGRSDDGKFLGYRYGENFRIDLHAFSGSQIENLRAEGGVSEPWNAVNEEWRGFTEKLVSLIQQKGASVLNLRSSGATKMENLDNLVDHLRRTGSRPIWVMGYYKTSFRNLSPGDREELETIAEQLVRDAAANGDTLITSGTTAGIEGLIHKKAAEHNASNAAGKVRVIGTTHVLKNPGELDPSLNTFVLVERDYASAIQSLAPVVKQLNGEAVFLGANSRFPEQIKAVTQNDIVRRYWGIDKSKLSEAAAGLESDIDIDNELDKLIVSPKSGAATLSGKGRRKVIALDVDQTLGVVADISLKSRNGVLALEYVADQRAYQKYKGRVEQAKSAMNQTPFGKINYDILPDGRLRAYFILRPGVEDVIAACSSLVEEAGAELVITSTNDPSRIRAMMETLQFNGRTLADMGAKYLHRNNFTVGHAPGIVPKKSFAKIRQTLDLAENDLLLLVDDQTDKLIDVSSTDFALSIPKFTPEIGAAYIRNSTEFRAWAQSDQKVMGDIIRILSGVVRAPPEDVHNLQCLKSEGWIIGL